MGQARTGKWVLPQHLLNGCNVVVSRIVDGVDLWKLTNPASKGQKPAHHALIVAKEAVRLSVRFSRRLDGEAEKVREQ